MWLGLDFMARLTADESLVLHVYMEDFDGDPTFFSYSHFSIADSSDTYRLNISEYVGISRYDRLRSHHGREFSTYDSNNGHGSRCAYYYQGGWWFTACYNCYLNAEYIHIGVIRCGISAKYVVMKLKPRI